MSFRLAPWVASALLLLVPLLAMRVTDEVAWGAGDFVVAGGLLFGACAAYEMASRTAGSTCHRAAVAMAVLTGLALIWINLAVGVVGSESNPANLMFAGVIGVALVGSAFVRLRPQGMAVVLAATAVAQLLAGLIAQVGGMGAESANGPLGTLVLTGVFAALWLASAWLFRMEARARENSGA